MVQSPPFRTDLTRYRGPNGTLPTGLCRRVRTALLWEGGPENGVTALGNSDSICSDCVTWGSGGRGGGTGLLNTLSTSTLPLPLVNIHKLFRVLQALERISCVFNFYLGAVSTLLAKLLEEPLRCLLVHAA